MTEQNKSSDSSMSQQSESDVLVIIKEIYERLVSLEKKIDVFINQPQGKQFTEKPSSKPFRPFPRPAYSTRQQGNRSQREASGERRDFTSRHFEKRQGEENRGFGGPKKDYRDDRENGSSQDRPFKKKFGGKKGGFVPGKKPFFHKRKEQ